MAFVVDNANLRLTLRLPFKMFTFLIDPKIFNRVRCFVRYLNMETDILTLFWLLVFV